jgi:soluble P-type ATPase
VSDAAQFRPVPIRFKIHSIASGESLFMKVKETLSYLELNEVTLKTVITGDAKNIMVAKLEPLVALQVK